MKTIFGYDPGGNGGHGVAALTVDDSYKPTKIVVQTQETVKDVINWFSQFKDPTGIGIDTLTKWATGKSGWRPADLWLRKQYPDVALSVSSPNSLYSSMTVGGMVVKSWFFNQYPNALISETHPKVLYFALKKQKHDWVNTSKEMMDFHSEKLGIFCELRCEQPNDHEFDSAISCYAVLEYLRGNLKRDLHVMPFDDRCAIYIEPYGNSIYAWP
ncbi:MAG: hypothetical protein WCO53_05590 [Deltaproteobacteria bacterium]